MSSDGQVLIAGTTLWDLQTARKLPVPEQIRMLEPRGVAMDLAGVTVALEGYADVLLWNRKTGVIAVVALDPWTNKRRPGLSVLAFSADGSRLAVGRYDGYVAIIDLKTSGITKVAHPSQAAVAGAAFSADAKRLMFVNYGGVVFEAAMTAALPVRRLGTLHDLSITQAAFSPDLRLIAFIGGGEGGRLKLWNASESKREPDVEVRMSYGIEAINFAAEGRELIVGGWGGEIVAWDVQRHSTIMTLSMRYAGGGLSRLATSLDGKTIAAVGRDKGGILVWDRALPNEPLGQAVLSSDKREIRAVSRSGAMVAFVQNGALWLLRSEGTTPVQLSDKAELFGLAAFSPDEQLLITGADLDEAATLRFWNTQTGMPIGQQSTAHHRGVSHIVFAPDGQRFVTSGSDREIAVWETSTRRRVDLENVVHREGIAELAFSHDGRVLASAGNDRTVQVWDASTLKPLYAAFRLEQSVHAMAFSPDGKILVLADRSHFIHLRDAVTGARQLDRSLSTVSSRRVRPSAKTVKCSF
jgi:WD40 repeat protein